MVKRKSHSLVHYNTLNRIDNLSFDNNIVAFMELTALGAILKHDSCGLRGACHLNWWHTSVNEYMVILDVRNWITNFPGVYIDMIHSKTFIAIVEVTSFLSSEQRHCCCFSVQFTYRAESLMVQ